MASSLEELLAEEGFKGRKSSMTRSRASFGSDNIVMPRYGSRDQRNSDSLSGNRMKTQRTRSDTSRYSFNGRLGRADSAGARRMDNLMTMQRINGKGMELLERRRSVERLGDGRVDVDSHSLSGNEIVGFDVEKDERIKDIYFSEVNGRVCNGINESVEEDTKSDRRDRSSSNKHLFGDPSSTGSGRTSMKQPGLFAERPGRGLRINESSEANRIEKHALSIFSDSLPALDEVAIKATISILTGYITRFIKDKDFRVNLRDKCFSSLDFIDSEVYPDAESKVLVNLEQAIETVERASEENASTKDLKRVSLQLSVITGLNTSELKDGFTCGLPNYKLAACAHLYLSVIYKLHKKDRISAKHIVQVFADSPLQGRTVLLPELWENFFYPHLSHLMLWHSQEVDSLVDTPSRARKLKLLDKLYNEILDSGTYQLAVYYKDWLTEGSEAPPFPSISIPSVSIHTAQLSDSLDHSGELANPVSAPYPQPLVSKRLFDTVLGRSKKPGNEHDEDGEIRSCMRSSRGSSVDVNEMSTYSYETVKHMVQHSIANSKNLGDEELPEDGLLLTADKESGSLETNISLQKDKNDEGSNSSSPQQISVEAGLRHTPSNNVIQAKSSSEVSYRSRGYSDEGPSTIPQYLICPLTSQLFEDPVTLETGQTFERAAIRKWFDEGNKTCPVTGNSLECLALPLTNLVIKCVIDSWKSKHCKNILSVASRIMEEKGSLEFAHSDDESISILEQLVTIYTKEERTANAKHLISLGGLQFLFRRFEFGMIEEKKRVAALLLCCIEADAACREQIAKGINIQCLLELLHSKQIEARTNAVSLLTELICLNRRKDVTDILSGLPKEEMVNAMHVLLLYLRSSRCQERPLVAVLLLHLDMRVGPQKYSIYREEAVDAIAEALSLSLTDENVKARCCRALSVLGGCFSIYGKLMESCILRQAAEDNVTSEANFEDNKEQSLSRDDVVLFGDEDMAHRQWSRYLLMLLLSKEKKTFLEAISKCLASKDSNLVKVCLTTVAWLSFALSSLSDVEFQLSTFSALVCQLKGNLECAEEIEHKILASFCLLNFSNIPGA